MVWRCSGLYLYFFFLSFPSSYCCLSRVARYSSPLYRRRRRALFFSSISIIFSRSDAISRSPDRVMFYLSTFCTAQVFFVFSSARSPPPIISATALRSFTRARRRRLYTHACTHTHTHIHVHVCSPRIIMCKKTQPIRSCTRSPGIPSPRPLSFFSSYHFQQVANQVLYVATVHGSYYTAAHESSSRNPFSTWITV
jgi:hypothetical protein